MNVTRIERLASHLEKLPKGDFSAALWHLKRGKALTACIAGWACELWGKKRLDAPDFDPVVETARILGMKRDVAEELCTAGVRRNVSQIQAAKALRLVGGGMEPSKAWDVACEMH